MALQLRDRKGDQGSHGRMYLAAQGLGIVDPLASKAPGLTPYRYAFNNPISVTDPTGMFESSNALYQEMYDQGQEENEKGREAARNKGKESNEEKSTPQELSNQFGPNFVKNIESQIEKIVYSYNSTTLELADKIMELIGYGIDSDRDITPKDASFPYSLQIVGARLTFHELNHNWGRVNGAMYPKETYG